MQTLSRSMSRRYRYEPRMTARQLSEAMEALELTPGHLAKISGVGIPRIHKWLKGEEDIAVHVQRDLEIWQRFPEGLDLALRWADKHAYDVRTDDGAQ